MTLSREDVEKVASLARLEVTEDELDRYAEQLGKIVTFVEQLNDVATDGVEPMAHPLDVHSVLRPDSPSQGITREAALANAPSTDGEFFLVPPVMGGKR